MDEIFKELVNRYPLLFSIIEEIEQVGIILVRAFSENKKLMVCGNGGSAADSEHIVGELMKSFVKKRPINQELTLKLIGVDSIRGNRIAKLLEQGAPAISLTGTISLATAFSNDVDPQLVFAQQINILGIPGDVFLGISTSGNAENVINAAIVAKAKGLSVIGLTGKSGGDLIRYCDVCLCAPVTNTYLVQELHLPIYHSLCLFVESQLWPDV
ncbi:MAG: SIS domain-containing protein [Sphaerochaetaceae bacterium]|nr:SIS domain-containing protein [Sphaerochaetaceae bacterium]